MTDRRTLLREIFDSAVASAHPDKILGAYLPHAPRGRIICLAAGKAAAAMAAATERHYLDELAIDPARLSGIATTRHGHGVPTRRIEVVEAGHPVPDEAGLKSTERTLQLAREAGADDMVLVLLSGGGSANWIAPASGVSFAQKQDVTRSLLRSGAPISEVNAVRKHLSRIKGGRLARAAYPAQILTLAISDVPHDDPAVIASGPTVADATTLHDAREIIARYRLSVENAVRLALLDGGNESCKTGEEAIRDVRYELIARPRTSLEVAVAVARRAGYDVIDLGPDLEGDAQTVANAHAEIALKAQSENKRVAIMSGGELTVTVRGTGRGGPNQEYVLALVNRLADTTGICALAGDTDGADGGAGAATDPAGALMDDRTFAAMRRLELEPTSYLANNDATAFFEATGDLLVTGPTLTNVNDIRVILVDPIQSAAAR